MLRSEANSALDMDGPTPVVRHSRKRRSVEARVSNQVEKAAKRVTSIIREHTQALFIAARAGHPPITQIEPAVVELMGCNELGAVDPEKVLKLVAETIEAILLREQYVPVRAEPFEIGPTRARTHKVYFVRKAEFDLFDIVDRGEPVTLATTADVRRFGRALVSNYFRRPEAGQRRRVFLWTIASGLFELTERNGEAIYHPAGSAALYEPTVTVRRLSEVCEERGEERNRVLFEEVGKSSSAGMIGVNDHGLKFFSMVSHGDSLAPRHDILLDDFDGDEPVDLDGADLALLQARFQHEAAQEHANQDRWPVQGKDGQAGDRMSLNGLLDFIMQRQTEGALFILYDTEVFLSQSAMGQTQANITGAFLRDACIRLRRGGKGTQVVALSTPTLTPASLTGEVAHINLPLPSKLELLSEVRLRAGIYLDVEHAESQRAHPLQATDDVLNIVDAAAGMTLSDVGSAIRTTVKRGATTGTDIVHAITQAKRAAIRNSAALELVDREPPRDLVLGGMERFWRWLGVRHRVFTHPELASQAGINQRPKGVLILGIPGTGKSLAAKIIARQWQVPLVRLDMGAIQNRWVGASEERIREALQIVQAMSPCVLWIDEIDKGVAQGEGTSVNSVDQNVRATLLTWLQENESAVFVVATANRFANLPPELTRAGRFDARFFFGCPDVAGREEILKIHLVLRRVSDITDVEVRQVAEGMTGFTGAEIEQTVLDGLYEAFAAERSPRVEDFLDATSRVKPLIRAIGKGLDEVWALIEQGRVELASDRFLTRADVARLIDPESFSPMYCRLDRISGWEQHAERASRILMRDQIALPAAVVLKTGDDEWVYVQTNVRMEPGDQGVFKFLDKLDAIDSSGVLDTLVVQCGVETIWFEDERVLGTFKKRAGLESYSEMFHVLPKN